ncbi:hypothetical protein Ancab_032825 [Ancistrocladus abbreviatus]
MADLNFSKFVFTSVFCLLIIFLEPEINVLAAGSDLEDILPSPYDKMPWKAAPATTWNGYSLKYIQNEDLVTFALFGAYKEGWLGIGLSKTGGMVGASAMVGWIAGDGKGFIKQYLLNGYTPSQVVADKGDLQLTNVAPVALLVQGTLYMAFQLKLAGANMKQKVILASAPDTPQDNLLLKHTAKALIEMDFSAGPGTVVDFSKQKATHGMLGILAWVILLPWGTLLPAFFKHYDPQWFYIHITVQVVGYISATLASFYGLKLESDMRADLTTHKYVGIIVHLFGTLQVCAMCARPAKDSSKRKYWNRYHRGVGYLAIWLGIINAGLGIRRAGGGSSWFIAHILLVVCYATATIVLEILSKPKVQQHQTVEAPVFDVQRSQHVA